MFIIIHHPKWPCKLSIFTHIFWYPVCFVSRRIAQNNYVFFLLFRLFKFMLPMLSPFASTQWLLLYIALFHLYSTYMAYVRNLIVYHLLSYKIFSLFCSSFGFPTIIITADEAFIYRLNSVFKSQIRQSVSLDTLPPCDPCRINKIHFMKVVASPPLIQFLYDIPIAIRFRIIRTYINLFSHDVILSY